MRRVEAGLREADHRAVRAGKLAAVPAIRRFEPDGVELAGGSRRPVDAVILATGYSCRVGSFLEDAGQVVDDRGYPRRHGREAGLPGLFFVGYANPVSGALREIAIEARRVARAIAAGAQASAARFARLGAATQVGRTATWSPD